MGQEPYFLRTPFCHFQGHGITAFAENLASAYPKMENFDEAVKYAGQAVEMRKTATRCPSKGVKDRLAASSI